MHLLFVVGPTASGKSDIALRVAEELKTEIISCDSVQVYRGLDKGTSKPSQEELNRVRHHLIDHVELGGSYTAGQFRRDSLGIIADADTRGLRHLIVVGGTGFYFQALLKGMFPIPAVNSTVRTMIETELKTRGLQALFEELQISDPEYATLIGPKNWVRIVRALEVIRSHPEITITKLRKEMSAKRLSEKPSFQFTLTGIRRTKERLRELVSLRTTKMIESGLVQEVEHLVRKGYGDWPPMKSIGYSETQKFLRSELDKESLIREINQNTLYLAKRQTTWFKRESIEWFDPDLSSSSSGSTQEVVSRLVQLARDKE